MYNGIGLPTPRGSGTNGFVQRNLAHVKKSHQTKAGIVSQPDADIDKPPNFELITHERKRQIEAKCLRYRQELEEDRYSPNRIERKVDEYRQSKLRELSHLTEGDHGDRIKRSFGIRKDYVDGSSVSQMKRGTNVKSEVKEETKQTTAAFKTEVKTEPTKNDEDKKPDIKVKSEPNEGNGKRHKSSSSSVSRKRRRRRSTSTSSSSSSSSSGTSSDSSSSSGSSSTSCTSSESTSTSSWSTTSTSSSSQTDSIAPRTRARSPPRKYSDRNSHSNSRSSKSSPPKSRHQSGRYSRRRKNRSRSSSHHSSSQSSQQSSSSRSAKSSTSSESPKHDRRETKRSKVEDSAPLRGRVRHDHDSKTKARLHTQNRLSSPLDEVEFMGRHARVQGQEIDSHILKRQRQ